MRPEAERGIVFMKKWKKVLAAGLLTVLFSCAVCAQAISAGNGRDMLHTDAHGLAVGTAAGGKGPPSKLSGGQEYGQKSIGAEKTAVQKEVAENDHSKKVGLHGCTGEKTEYQSSSGYEEDMESGQMPGTGQISGLETGRGEKPACSTSAVQKEMSCDPGVEARGIYKAAGHPKTQYISGKGYVQKRQEQENSDLEPGYKQKNGQDSCEETEISLMAEGGAKEFDRQKKTDGLEEPAGSASAQKQPEDVSTPGEKDKKENPEKQPEQGNQPEQEKQPEQEEQSGQEAQPEQGNQPEQEAQPEQEEQPGQEEQPEQEVQPEQDTSGPLLEEQIPGQYSRISDMYLRSAATSTIQVGWQESLGSIDPGLLSLDDPYNVSIKYVDSSDSDNQDMRGKWRLLYCVQYQHNAPEGQITWDGAGRVSPSIAYLMYWGCRYWGQESLWPNYRTGYGWKYDALATQYAVHIVNGEFSLNTLYNHLKGSKKEQFYSIINKMVNDANHPPYYTPFADGWRDFDYALSDSSVTWTAQDYNGKAGFTTKWISQNLSDGLTDCSEYITSKKGTADNGATVIWKDSGDASAFRIWIPKTQYLLLQEKGAKVTATISGNHSLYLAGWVYKSSNSKYQMVTMLEGGGGSAAHKKTVTAQIPKKAVSCYIDLQKADKDTEETKPQGNAEFSGAVYEVKNKAGTVVDKMTTNTSGKATSVPLATGTYIVREVTAPKGYNLDKNTYTVTFTNTDLNQTVYRKSVRSEEPVKKGNVTLKKLSSESDKTLKGAVFYLYTSKNKKVGEYTTDDKGCITVKNLPWNSYFFIEQTAPEGYELSDEKIAFSINKESAGKTLEVAARNTPRKVKLILEKEIRADEINFANGNPIFLFEVKGVDLEGKTHILHRTAEFTREYTEQEKNSDGTIRKTVTFSELPAGTYTAYEMEVMRYSLEDITEITGGTRKEDTVVFDLIQNDAGRAVFINHKDEWQDWSDTSVCENIILKREKEEHE